MDPTVPPPESQLLAVMLKHRDVTAKELARRSGITERMMSRYLNERAPSPELLAEFAAHLGYTPEELDLLLLVFRDTPPLPGPRTPIDPTPGERRTLRRTAFEMGLAFIQGVEHFGAELFRGRHARSARRAAGRLWRRLREATPAQRRLLVEKTREAQTWAVVERLCAESVKEAAHDADVAFDLASLACRAAELAPAEEPWHSALLAYALAFLANAFRVRGDLPGADQTFKEANRLWEVGSVAGSGPLAAWRLPDLEASLRRDQRRWSEALILHDRALAEAPQREAGRLLLSRSTTLILLGETARATETLREAATRIDARREPRQLWVLQFNLAANLCRSEQFAEAEALISEVRELAIRLGNGLDLIRVLWIQGKVHAGFGRREEAIAAFQQVLRDFTNRKIPYDAALVGLELSVLNLEQGRATEVREVALGLAWIFTAEGVDEETLKAIALFYDAALQEAATIELSRRLVRYLDRASLQPGLPFEV